MIKRIVKNIYIFTSRIFMSVFYDSKMLVGKHFENNIQGWNWCWKNFHMQKIKGYNKSYPVPVSFRSDFSNYKNIKFSIEDLNNFNHFGCYFQAWKGCITIGEGTYIAPNVGIITSNHSVMNLDEHDDPKDVIIGRKCWIGMNVVILPGVILGDNTIVGAGSIVTKSFEDGNCVIVGNPASIKKILR